MAVIRLTKEFSFEAAHALDGYDGPCREIHGHSYRLFVTVAGRPVADPENPKYGMVMDFGVLKRIVNEQIVSRFDHAFVLRDSERGRAVREALDGSFYEHRRRGLSAHVREHARRLRPPHRFPLPEGSAPFAAAPRDGHVVRRVVRRGQPRMIRSTLL